MNSTAFTGLREQGSQDRRDIRRMQRANTKASAKKLMAAHGIPRVLERHAKRHGSDAQGIVQARLQHRTIA